MLAIEIQAEALAITAHQVVRLAERRLLLVAHGTPTHAITEAMLAEHEHGILRRTFLESRINLRNSVLAIEGGRTLVHHVAQVSELALRESMIGLRHGENPLTIVHLAGLEQLLDGLTTGLSQHR